MTHLGSRISALADGQLTPSDTERALAHVVSCRLCAGELAAARDAHRAVSRIADVVPAPDLTARLLALGERVPVSGQPPVPDARGFTIFPTTSALTPRHPFPVGGMTGDVTGHHGTRLRWMAGSVAGAGMVAAALFTLGAAPTLAPTEHPAETMLLLAQAGGPQLERLGGSSSMIATVTFGTGGGSTAGSSLAPPTVGGDPKSALSWMLANGWSCPGELPTGTTITALRLSGTDGDVLEVDLDTPRGQFIVTEQHGLLDAAALAGSPEVQVGGATAYVLSRAPWHLAWQSEDVVMQVVSASAQDQVEQIVREFPSTAYDDAAAARIARGWQALTGAISQR